MIGEDGRREGSRIDPWVLEYNGYDRSEESLREALCTVGNGRFATRGAAPECPADDDAHYPGTYVAGIYNRLSDEIAGRTVENESLVNLPNWLPVTFRADDGDWFSIDEVDILFFRQALEIDRGILVREIRFRDHAGRETSVSQRRLVHMSRPSLAALETTIRPENWSGRLTFRSTVDANVRNRNVKRYRDLSDQHLDLLAVSSADDICSVRVRTNQSRIEVVVGARHRLWVDGTEAVADRGPVHGQGLVGEELAIEVRAGSELRLEKVVSIRTSKDMAISEPGLSVVDDLKHAPDFTDLEDEHVSAWLGLWSRFRVDLGSDLEVCQATNFHIFHLLQVASPNVLEIDAGIPARGLHGEAYRGHIFWDELFVFPVLHARSPEVARSLLRYRHRRLPAARRAAAAAGFEGAMFPWQSGSDGREETQEMHLNPRSGRWHPDRSHRQRHLNIAIGYNVIQYLRFTRDIDFLAEQGAEMLIELCRFWASIADYDRIADRYDIVGVMGPDEFHDNDPNWPGSGLRNNAYTNVMTSWLLASVPESLEPLPRRRRDHLFERFGLDHRELARWDEISRKLKVPFHEGDIISQFEGYADLEELDWESYERRYESSERLDRILEAEGDSVNRFKASKQADVLMLFYLLSFEELTDTFGRLGVRFDEDILAKNIDYYLARTSHGSTLSRLVHSWVLARSDRRRSMELFREVLRSDLHDIQGGTTPEGIHLGAMAGTLDLLQRGYSGMEAAADGTLSFKPSLDPAIGRLDFCVYFHRRWIEVSIEDGHLRLTSEVTTRPPVRVAFRGEEAWLASGETREFRRSE
jgi:trehalose/maltose hydrolase-like predicted phosphorylase